MRGPHSTVDNDLASHPAEPGSILGIIEFFQRNLKVHCLERVDRAKLKS